MQGILGVAKNYTPQPRAGHLQSGHILEGYSVDLHRIGCAIISFRFPRGPSTHLGLGWRESGGLLKAADNEFAGYPTRNIWCMFIMQGIKVTFRNLDVDWRQPKPKMHVPSQSDPAPDSQFFRDHVMCEHGGLALNIAARTRISHKVWQS